MVNWQFGKMDKLHQVIALQGKQFVLTGILNLIILSTQIHICNK